VLFADDTTILYSHDDIASKIDVINKELEEVTQWFKANKLSVNAGKTNYMLMGTRHGNSKYVTSSADKNITIELDNTKLQRVNSTKFLGVIIDENLTWKNHIDGISKTIARNIGVLNKLKHSIPERILYSLYCTLILPYVNYSVLVWGNTYQSYMDKIFKLQKWAVRTVSNSHYRSHSAPLFQRFNILNVYDTYKLEVSVFMFRHSRNQLPSTFKNFFIKQIESHDYNTRNSDDYILTRNKKVFSDQTVRTSGPLMWKSLDQNLKMSASIKQFRSQFKRYLLSQY